MKAVLYISKSCLIERMYASYALLILLVLCLYIRTLNLIQAAPAYAYSFHGGIRCQLINPRGFVILGTSAVVLEVVYLSFV